MSLLIGVIKFLFARVSHGTIARRFLASAKGAVKPLSSLIIRNDGFIATLCSGIKNLGQIKLVSPAGRNFIKRPDELLDYSSSFQVGNCMRYLIPVCICLISGKQSENISE